MDALTFKKKALKALSGMYDVMIGAGDPLLASMIRKAMECVERWPLVHDAAEPKTLDLKDSLLEQAIARLKELYENAQTLDYVYNKMGWALYHTWSEYFR